MKYFLAFCVIFSTNIFASDAREIWEYTIGCYHNKQGIIATRCASGLKRKFFVLEDEFWTYENFFLTPKVPCKRHLIGEFTLKSMPTYAECFARGAQNMQQITNHRMFLSLSWFYNEDGELERGSLKNLGYADSSVSVQKISR